MVQIPVALSDLWPGRLSPQHSTIDGDDILSPTLQIPKPSVFGIPRSRRVRIVVAVFVVLGLLGVFVGPRRQLYELNEASFSKWRHPTSATTPATALGTFQPIIGAAKEENPATPSTAAPAAASLSVPSASASSIPIWPAGEVDWSRFAYIQYVTNQAYLCNSVMLFEILNRLESKADRLMMYPDTFDVNDDHRVGGLLRKARDEYKVKLKAVKVQQRESEDSTWAESFTKLLAFNQTQYSRVLHLDSDSTLLQNLDELFFLPLVDLAIPRGYWLDQTKGRILNSQLMVIKPSAAVFNYVQKAVNAASQNEYDMDIVTNLYRDSALLIPHRPYNILTSVFRGGSRTKYIGNDYEKWDPELMLKEAKYLHFSDWPLRKPWLSQDPSMVSEKQPKCEKTKDREEDCRSRDLWLGFYQDFAERRKVICDVSLMEPRDLENSIPKPGKYEAIV